MFEILRKGPQIQHGQKVTREELDELLGTAASVKARQIYFHDFTF